MPPRVWLLFILAVGGACSSSAPPPAAAPTVAPAPPRSEGPYAGIATITTKSGESDATATPLTEESCAGLLAIDPQQPPYRLQVPAALSDGRPVHLSYKLFVSSKGKVFGVEIVARARIARVDVELTRTLLKWRYRPHVVSGQPVHFSCPLSVEAL